MPRTPATGSGRPQRAAGPVVFVTVALSLLALTGSSAAGSLAPAPAAEAAASPSLAPAGLTIAPRPSQTARPSPIARPGSRPRPTAAAATPSSAVPDVPVVEARPSRPVSDRRREPARVRLDAVDIDVAVRPADDGTMAIPGTVRRAGWYRFGARPSDSSGSTVIAAHVDTRKEGLGPFARLSSAGKGDAVVVTDRDGREVRYRITTLTRVRRTKLPVDDLFDRDGSPRLVLLTCGGAYHAGNGYADNVVVIAVPDR